MAIESVCRAVSTASTTVPLTANVCPCSDIKRTAVTGTLVCTEPGKFGRVGGGGRAAEITL